MNNDKRQQAKNLFFQTELSKTQIATVLHISRRSLHYWIKEGNWERLKTAANHLPSLLAENCYHIIGHLTEYYMSERRLTNSVSHKEADTLHKLAITIGKLKNRSTLNENMEMFAFFLDDVKKKNPKMAEDIAPYVDEYICSRGDVSISSVMPENFTAMRRLPTEETDYTEQQLDMKDLFDWDNEYHDSVAAIAASLPSQPQIPFPAEAE